MRGVGRGSGAAEIAERAFLDQRAPASRRGQREQQQPTTRGRRDQRPGEGGGGDERHHRGDRGEDRDKKMLGDQLTFVLDGTQGVEVVAGVTAEAALAALASMR